MSVSTTMLVALALTFNWTPMGNEYETETRETEVKTTFIGANLLYPDDGVDATDQMDIWNELGLCGDPKIGDCEWSDESPRCKAQEARGLPCRRSEKWKNPPAWWLRNTADYPDSSWTDQWGKKPDCPILLPPPKTQPNTTNCVPWGYTGVEVLHEPRWVPSAEPTGVGEPGFWLKLQL